MYPIHWEESVHKFNCHDVNTFTLDETLYFYGTDIATILEYPNVNFAITMHIHGSDRKSRELLVFGRSIMDLVENRKMRGSLKGTYITANGVISLLQNSPMRDIEPFKKWLKVTFPVHFKMLAVREDTPKPAVTPIKPVTPVEKKKKAPKKAEVKVAVPKEKKKIVPYDSYVSNYTPVEKKQIFYIASTALYVKENRYKFGGIANKKDLNSRLQKYNTGRPEFDNYYYCKVIECHNYRMIEERLHCICSQFKDKMGSRKEMVVIPYELLSNLVETICNHCDQEMKMVDELVKK